MTCSARRRGFTFIELLIVSGIMAILVALLLPAVQQAREAARRTTCKNNLKQLGLALQTYHDQYNMLPAGTVNATGPIRNVPVGYHHNWVIALLPFLDQPAVEKQFDPRRSVYDVAHNDVRRHLIPTLLCPTDDETKRHASITTETLEPALTNYAGCHHPVEAPIDADNRGLLYLNSFLPLTSIPDGTSHTVAIGEFKRAMDDLGWASGTRSTLRNCGIPVNQTPGGRAYYRDPAFQRDALSHGRRTEEDLNGPSAQNALVEPPADEKAATLIVGGFGSYHVGGVQVVRADGSVHFVSQNINPPTWSQLGDRADGELPQDW